MSSPIPGDSGEIRGATVAGDGSLEQLGGLSINCGPSGWFSDSIEHMCIQYTCVYMCERFSECTVKDSAQLVFSHPRRFFGRGIGLRS